MGYTHTTNNAYNSTSQYINNPSKVKYNDLPLESCNNGWMWALQRGECHIHVHTYICNCIMPLQGYQIHPPHHINTLLPPIVLMPLQGYQTRHMASMDSILYEQQKSLQEGNPSTSMLIPTNPFTQGISSLPRVSEAFTPINNKHSKTRTRNKYKESQCNTIYNHFNTI